MNREENIERSVIPTKTFMAVLVSGVASAVIGTVTVCTYLNNISAQVTHVSSQIDLTNQTVANLAAGRSEDHQWILSLSDKIDEHEHQLDEIMAAQHDAAEKANATSERDGRYEKNQ